MSRFSFNQVALLGRVGKDPEVKQVGERKVATFTMATTESFKDNNSVWQDKTEWHNIVAWAHLAEYISETGVKKGSQVVLHGKITNRSWEKDGIKHYRTEIVASHVLLTAVVVKSGTQEKSQAPSQQAEDDDLPF